MAPSSYGRSKHSLNLLSQTSPAPSPPPTHLSPVCVCGMNIVNLPFCQVAKMQLAANCPPIHGYKDGSYGKFQTESLLGIFAGNIRFMQLYSKFRVATGRWISICSERLTEYLISIHSDHLQLSESVQKVRVQKVQIQSVYFVLTANLYPAI